jgi:hypothetical protein
VRVVVVVGTVGTTVLELVVLVLVLVVGCCRRASGLVGVTEVVGVVGAAAVVLVVGVGANEYCVCTHFTNSVTSVVVVQADLVIVV